MNVQTELLNMAMYNWREVEAMATYRHAKADQHDNIQTLAIVVY